MALHHFYRNARRVRLGGRSVFGRRVGGGWYTVVPLSVLRFLQFIEASGQLTATPVELANLASVNALRAMVPLVPLLVLEPVKDAHLRRITAAQLAELFVAVGETTDLEYCVNAIKPPEGDAGGVGRVGFEIVAVSLAERFHVGDPYQVLHWPMAQVAAIMDALKDRDEATKTEGTVDAGLTSGLRMAGMMVT